jgi:hypothetical protein
MGKFELSQIKNILQTVSAEIKVVHDEAVRNQGNISDLKVEKLKKLLVESKDAVGHLKDFNVSLNPESEELQKSIDTVMSVRPNTKLNPSVLQAMQAIMFNMHQLNLNLSDIRIDDKDHKRGQRVENVDHERL